MKTVFDYFAEANLSGYAESMMLETYQMLNHFESNLKQI